MGTRCGDSCEKEASLATELLLVVHRSTSELFALRVGSAHRDRAALAIGRHDNTTAGSNFCAFLNRQLCTSWAKHIAVARKHRARVNRIVFAFISPSVMNKGLQSCVESYPELGTREAVFLRRRTAGLRHSN